MKFDEIYLKFWHFLNIKFISYFAERYRKFFLRKISQCHDMFTKF
jgi:hypothetical protein